MLLFTHRELKCQIYWFDLMPVLICKWIIKQLKIKGDKLLEILIIQKKNYLKVNKYNCMILKCSS